MVELRIDPDDGKAYTLEQVQKNSELTYSPEEIMEYWAEMVPVNGSKTSSQIATFTIKLSVHFNERTSEALGDLTIDIPWQDILRDFEFKSTSAAMTISTLATWIESIIEGNCTEIADGKDPLQVQLAGMWRSGRSDLEGDIQLPFEDEVSQHLISGDTVIVDAYAMQASMLQKPSQKTLENFRSKLRFGLNDRVVCNCGRWLSGHIVGTAVPVEGSLLPYLVKIDKHPKLPSATISVPEDKDDVCIQEVCFDPCDQLWLTQAAAADIPETSRPKLRFAVGDKVCCRVRNSSTDGLEQWASGEVSALWPKLSGELDQTWDMDGVSGNFPEFVPYQVQLTSKTEQIYCHRDDHTLIRREGMQPVTRVRGLSKRIEIIKKEDGEKELVDHVTERRKSSFNEVEDLSDSD